MVLGFNLCLCADFRVLGSQKVVWGLDVEWCRVHVGM